jgi:hypothetical protein
MKSARNRNLFSYSCESMLTLKTNNGISRGPTAPHDRALHNYLKGNQT